VNKSVRKHTAAVCDVYGYHPEMLRLFAVIKFHVPKDIKYLEYLKDYQLQKNHSASSNCDAAFLS
jgi:hypothetical protein